LKAILAGQPPSTQVAGPHGTVYGSEGRARISSVVSGPPASGKTTLAQAIAPALGLPLIAKDTIKQALMTVLPVPDIQT
jgi:replication-associated recombination protein RarA